MRHPHTNLRLRNGHKNEWNICNVTFLKVHPRSKNEAKVSHFFAVRFYAFLSNKGRPPQDLRRGPYAVVER